MYKGFNLQTSLQSNKYSKYIESFYNDIKHKIENNLDKFVCENGNLDGDKIINNWFPEVKTQVFISHSHSDEELAKNFAGWLKYKFNIDSFIDSCVWGYANDLLKQIDENHSLFNGESGHYDYNKRNYSTSHVHMMLSTALMNMMDRCECIIFLNTKNSTIETKGSYTTDKDKVSSPWIYDELIMTNFIRRKFPKRDKSLMEHSSIKKYATDSAPQPPLIIEYKAPLDALVPIDNKILTRWSAEYDNDKNIVSNEMNPETNELLHPLDYLYKITNDIEVGKQDE